MPRGPVRVWLWNGEDPYEEMELRVGAACLHYGISDEDLGGRLFIDSGRDKPIKLAVATRSGVVVAEKLVQRIMRGVKARRIDVLVIDPLVAAHYARKTTTCRWTW